MRPPRVPGPIALLALALLVAAILPEVAYRFTHPSQPGDFESALRAHVAWARVLALALAAWGAVALFRAALRDPARAARHAAATLLLGSLVAGAAALPAYDAWVQARADARYLDAAEGWKVLDSGWGDSLERRTYGYYEELPAHVGPVTVELPPLAKGDHVRAIVSYAAGGASGFWGSQLSTGSHGACEGWEAQMPGAPRADGTGPAVHSVASSECTVTRAGEDARLVARWGEAEPVDTRVSVLLRPLHVGAVAARADDSLRLVGALGALASFGAFSLAVRRSRPAGDAARASAAALLVGAALACLAWALAAAASEPFPVDDPAARTAKGSFVLVASLAALAAAGLLLALRREWDISPATAATWGAVLAAGVAALAPVAAQRVWRFEVPWVLLAMLATLATASLGVLAAGRLRHEAPAPAGEPSA